MNPGSQTLSVIIVNFNAGAVLAECVAAVLASPRVDELLISDNGSRDTSLERVRSLHGDDRRLRILENGANLGFARGNNVALRHTRSDYVLFLNPDCLLGADTLPRLLAFLEATPEAGMAGCIIRNPDGREQVASRRTIPDPWIGLVRFLRLERLWPTLVAGKQLNHTHQPLPAAPLPVEAISGALMLVRRQALEEVGPLDDGYFLHCEDLDWFVRFRNAGWAIYLIPGVEVVHHKGACSRAHPVAVEWHKHRGMVRFFRKFQFRRHAWPFSLLVVAGIWIHFAVFLITHGMRRLARLGAKR